MVLPDKQIQNLCREISKPSENFKCLAYENDSFTSELVAAKNVNNILENRIASLKNKYQKLNNVSV